jgi:hypothetical protein
MESRAQNEPPFNYPPPFSPLLALVVYTTINFLLVAAPFLVAVVTLCGILKRFYRTFVCYLGSLKIYSHSEVPLKQCGAYSRVSTLHNEI